MSFARDDVEAIIRNFYTTPNRQDYQNIKNWYAIRSQTADPTNFVNYVYMFLLGANMKNRFEPYSEEEHTSYVTRVRDLTSGSDPEARIRKGYFDFGLGQTRSK
jgi:hypothetical protein